MSDRGRDTRPSTVWRALSSGARAGALLAILLAVGCVDSPTVGPPDLEQPDPRVAQMRCVLDSDGDGVCESGSSIVDQCLGSPSRRQLVTMFGCTVPALHPSVTTSPTILIGELVTLAVDVTDRAGAPIVDGSSPQIRWNPVSDPCVRQTAAASTSAKYRGVAATSPTCLGTPSKIEALVTLPPSQDGEGNAPDYDKAKFRITVLPRPTLSVDVTEVDDEVAVSVNGAPLGTAFTQQPVSFDGTSLLRAGPNTVDWTVTNTSPGKGWTWGVTIRVDGQVIYAESCGMSPGFGCVPGDGATGPRLAGTCTFDVPLQAAAVCSTVLLPAAPAD